MREAITYLCMVVFLGLLLWGLLTGAVRICDSNPDTHWEEC